MSQFQNVPFSPIFAPACALYADRSSSNINSRNTTCIYPKGIYYAAMEHLLELCNPKSYIIVLGDTAPLSPILFDHGLNAISGTRVIDAELALRCVSQGANFRQIRGVRRLTMMR